MDRSPQSQPACTSAQTDAEPHPGEFESHSVVPVREHVAPMVVVNPSAAGSPVTPNQSVAAYTFL